MKRTFRDCNQTTLAVAVTDSGEYGSDINGARGAPYRWCVIERECETEYGETQCAVRGMVYSVAVIRAIWMGSLCSYC